MPSSITLGSRVFATVGPFLESVVHGNVQHSASDESRPTKRARRSRSKLYGTVIESVADGLWKVWWDSLNVTANHKSSNLRVPKDTNNRRNVIPIDDVTLIRNQLQSQQNIHIGSHQAMLDYTAVLSPQRQVQPTRPTTSQPE